MKFDISINGAKALDDLLKQLPPNVARRVAGNALRAAGRVIRDEAKQLVPVKTGDLKKSIKVVTGKVVRGGEERSVRVAVAGKELPLAHIVEFGSAAHKIATKTKRVLYDAGTGAFFGRDVSHPGTPAHPFLRPAADAKARVAVDVIGKALGDGIVKEALKLGNRK